MNEIIWCLSFLGGGAICLLAALGMVLLFDKSCKQD